MRRLAQPGPYTLRDSIPGVPGPEQRNYRAQATGEYRPPRRGEWYLSGALVEAYRAPADLSIPFHIARLERGHMVTVWRPSTAGQPDPGQLPYDPDDDATKTPERGYR